MDWSAAITWGHLAELALLLGLLAATAAPLGHYLQCVFRQEPTWLSPILGPFERAIYRLAGVDPKEEGDWLRYAKELLFFAAVSLLPTYAILRLQHWLPLNPQGFSGVSWHLALNTALSFATNTDWQSYGGESTLSYFAQMVGLTAQNFFSAATGLAAAMAVIRGLSRQKTRLLGNFWVDLVRGTLYVLLPLCLILAVFLASQGVVQNFAPYLQATTLEGGHQVIAQGPVASQVAIKMLGTNGGGFFNANAAHPYENPTALTNFVQTLAILLIPSALFYLLGVEVRSRKHGWTVWLLSALVLMIGTLALAHFEYRGHPQFAQLGLSSAANLEGKDVRFGIFDSALFTNASTDASCGATNAAVDSFTPLGGLVPMVNIQLGEIIFGGVGSGLYGMVLFIILTVFLSGLMVGRTPEYRGKKIEGIEVKLAMIAVIVAAAAILGLTAIAALSPQGVVGIGNPGAHGLSEMLYALTSATGNNGSAMAGLNTNTEFWNVILTIAMFCGRFLMMIPMLAVAGSLAGKQVRPESAGTFPVHGIMFMSLLFGVIVIVGALTYFPALALGPVVEHVQLYGGASH